MRVKLAVPFWIFWLTVFILVALGEIKIWFLLLFLLRDLEFAIEFEL